MYHTCTVYYIVACNKHIRKHPRNRCTKSENCHSCQASEFSIFCNDNCSSSICSTVGIMFLSSSTARKYKFCVVIPASNGNIPPQAPAVGNIVLLPPAGSTAVPKFTAPIIVPAMTPSDPDAATSPVATNPINNTLVSTAEDEDGTPDFDNDDQLLNFVSSRLWRVLKDCATNMQVGSGVNSHFFKTSYLSSSSPVGHL